MPETENGLTGWVYILLCDDGDWFFGACEGALSEQLKKHDRGDAGRPGAGQSILLWAEAAENLAVAQELRDAIAAWPSSKQESLVRGEIGASGS
jgi:predicted GIY-YIG superfamily endonuclease